MIEYLGVTINPITDEIQIICPSTAEAQALANELVKAFELRREKAPRVSADKVTYHDNVWALKQFLLSRRWKLTLDTKTHLMFDRVHDDANVTAG